MSNTSRAIPSDAPAPVGMTPIEEDHSINRHNEEAQLLVTPGDLNTPGTMPCRSRNRAGMPDWPAAFHNTSTLPDRVSKLAERFLPAAFVVFVLCRTRSTRTLRGLEIPIQRLTADDREQQPGAKPAPVTIVIILVIVIVTQQIYCFFLERRLLRYLGLYGLFLVGLVACFVVPGVDLRLHYYIFALLLCFLVRVLKRSSLLCQGLLLGHFVNGVARWGFASILQTPEALRSDGLPHTEVPSIHEPIISSMLDKVAISIAWAMEPSAMFDAMIVLVNEVG
ncbi:hypothetical protein F4823DRAFT_630074 [Ustulina deusta]|nr:hypothetical protein F4823DRAFT_630074 [Ustulina deusta]